MPKDIWPDDFHCPECGEKPSVYNAMTTQYSMYRLDLPYFMCGDCRVCGYDKTLIRQVIRHWNRHSRATRHTPYREIYLGSIKLLEESMTYSVARAGYRIAKFNSKKA